MSSTTTLTSSAYDIILLHLSKHPTATVFGFLLGRSNTSSSGSVEVQSVVPLSHHWTALAPIAEVGLALTTTYAESQGLTILGVYEAPRDVAERNPSGQALRLAEKIASLNKSGEATLLLVNNATLLTPITHSLLPFTVSASSSSSKSTMTTLPASTPKSKNQPVSSISFSNGESVESVVKAVENKIRQKAWKDVVDFDDHLEDPALSWLVQPSVVA